MTSIKLEPQGLKALKGINTHDRRVKIGIRKGYYFLGADLLAEARRSILEGPKTGRTYLIRRGKTRRRHRASAPGEPPANLSGALRKSIGFKVKGSDQLEFGAATEYAEVLELGGTKIKKRPYLIRAINIKQRNAEEHFHREIQRQLNKI